MGIKSYDDLKGKEVGAIAGSAAEVYLRQIGVRRPPFKTEVEELQSLNQGRVKDVLEDDVVFTEFAKANPNNKIEAAVDHRGAARTSSMAAATAYARYAIRKEDCQLRAAYTQALAELRANGQVSAILKKYGLTDRNLIMFKLQSVKLHRPGRRQPPSAAAAVQLGRRMELFNFEIAVENLGPLLAGLLITVELTLVVIVLSLVLGAAGGARPDVAPAPLRWLVKPMSR